MGNECFQHSDYQYSEGLRLWTRPSSSSVSFSDGDDAEEYLLKLFSTAKDLSTNSRELRQAIRDWPSEYHLSPLRHNLLRPFRFPQRCKVLEVGCGCGAISRQFGELGLELTALEGSLRRAQITATRCQDLPNVKVVADSFNTFNSSESFDLVTLIGVLEYAQVFCQGEEAVLRMLRSCFDLLDKNGTLIIAIENKLGLKYFAGHAEDHLGTAFAGIQDLYPSNGPITFGLKELIRLCDTAGFGRVEQFFPFPDYKLPEVMISELGLKDQSFCPAQLLAHLQSRSYGVDCLPCFDETLVWETLAENAQLDGLANSFLLMLHKGAGLELHDQWLATHFSIQDHPSLGTCSTFYKINDQSGIEVDKQPLIKSEKRVGNGSFEQLFATSAYHEGRLFSTLLKRILARSGDFDELGEWTSIYLNLLLEHRTESSEQPDLTQLPGDFVDCVPHNIVVTPDQELRYIDREWVASKPVPLCWVLIRGLAHAIDRCASKGSLSGQILRTLIAKLSKHAGYALSDKHFATAIEWERAFQSFVRSEQVTPEEQTHLESLLDSTIADHDPRTYYEKSHHAQMLTELEDQVGNLRKELCESKETIAIEQAELAELTAANNLSKQQLLERDQQAQQLKDSIARLEREKDLIQAEGSEAIQSKEEELAVLRAQYERMAGSLSWRVTKPLRLISSQMRRLLS